MKILEYQAFRYYNSGKLDWTKAQRISPRQQYLWLVERTIIDLNVSRTDAEWVATCYFNRQIP